MMQTRTTIAFTIPARKRIVSTSTTKQYIHSAVISPLGPSMPSLSTSSSSSPVLENTIHQSKSTTTGILQNFSIEENQEVITFDQPTEEQLSKLCHLFQATPSNLIRFESTNDGVRGVYLNDSVEKDHIILQLPLKACLIDTDSPTWLDKDIDDSTKWATRLAACWIDLYLQQQQQHSTQIEDTNQQGFKEWLSLLPDPEFLRASLPVHWSDETIQNAKSTSLELAVDSSYFTRAEAVEDIVASLVDSSYVSYFNSDNHEESSTPAQGMRDLAHRALDLVQTRSCRLEENDTSEQQQVDHRRVLAPIFDFINHGSRGDDDNKHNANAFFGLERRHSEQGNDEEYLVVRALHKLDANEEVLIDYGESTRPAWKCLLSYGFVPQLNEHTQGENLAEVYMMGTRYEVTTDTIPVGMVAAVAASVVGDSPLQQDGDDGHGIQTSNDIQPEDIVLTPDVARKIARRISDVGYFLLLEPELDPYDDFDEGESFDLLTPSEVLSYRLAASLRWQQHKVLLACAKGLENYAKEEEEQATQG
jgi:hypothetical protein